MHTVRFEVRGSGGVHNDIKHRYRVSETQPRKSTHNVLCLLLSVYAYETTEIM